MRPFTLLDARATGRQSNDMDVDQSVIKMGRQSILCLGIADTFLSLE